MRTDLIIVREYCEKVHIDPSFISLLADGGLIDIEEVDNERYFPADELRDIERYTRWYYDLSINIEGIDAIRHLVNRMEYLQSELNRLRTRLRLYQGNDFPEENKFENF